MGRLPVVGARDVERALAQIGYQVDRQRGSHIRMLCPGKEPVTIPNHHELAPGTLRAVIKGAGLTVDEFRDLLRK